MGEQENLDPKTGEVALTPPQNPPPKFDAAVHRTPEELMAKAIAPVKAEYLLPLPPTRLRSNGNGIDEDASERKGAAAATGIVKEKKSKRQLMREHRQVSGCELGWACSVAKNQKVNLQESKITPSRTTNCSPCCAGFFCPQGLTCMIRNRNTFPCIIGFVKVSLILFLSSNDACPLGAYCPAASLNKTTGICDPYNYQLPPGERNHTCSGADRWADVVSGSEVFVLQDSIVQQPFKKFLAVVDIIAERVLLLKQRRTSRWRSRRSQMLSTAGLMQRGL